LKAGSTIANVKGMKYFRSNIEEKVLYANKDHGISSYLLHDRNLVII